MLKEIFLQPDGQSSSRNKFAVTQKNLSRFQLGAKKSISYPPLTKSQTPPPPILDPTHPIKCKTHLQQPISSN